MKILDLFNKNYCLNDSVRFPYIIAEAGVNHEGDIDIAKRLIEEAKEGGAHAIKFQTYKASTIASKDSPAYWDLNKEPTDSQFKLFQKYDKFWKGEYEQLKQHCDDVGIEFMSTPFDVESANFLNDMMDVIKISSSDITNKPFIEYLCDFGKPIILSTGASYLHEIQEAVEWIEAKQVPVALLHCILNYPTDDQNAHLGMIKDLQRKYPDKIIGYSDHTLPNDMKVLEMATLLGAVVLEKHFTHDKTLPGNDHYHAMDKEDLKIFHNKLERMFTILGDQQKYPLEMETPARNNARRSLVANSDIPEGTVIAREHLTWKRPAHGISPRDIEDVLGKQAARTILEDEVLQWKMVN
ncbi:MAG: acetylneuraminic acid synthetase [Candidatus Scalindua sp.]|jgi:sialic acid synthase SpsE|nr:acetylneuraminic acid synthetase [Candidatus Scalindua sp.]